MDENPEPISDQTTLPPKYYQFLHVLNSMHLNEWMIKHNPEYRIMHRYVTNQVYFDTLKIKYIPSLILLGLSIGKSLCYPLFIKISKFIIFIKEVYTNQ